MTDGKRSPITTGDFVPLLGNGGMPRLLGHFGGWFTDSPCRDVDRGVVVGVGSMATRATLKLGLVLSVAFVAMSACRACAAGIAWVDRHDRNTVELSFVLNEITELRKTPPAHLGPFFTPEPCPVANAFEVFKGYAAVGAFGEKYERLTNDVAMVPAKPGLFRPDVIPLPSCVLTCPSFVLGRGFLPQGSAEVEVFLANRFDVFTRNVLPVAGGDNLRNAEVYAKKFFDIYGGSFGNVYGRQQEEFPCPINQIALPFDPVKPLALIFAIDKGDQLSAIRGHQTNPVNSLEAQIPLVVNHRPEPLEFRGTLLVSLEALDSLADCANGHLARQTKFLTQISVAPCVNGRLTENAELKSHIRRMGSGCVKPLHRVEQDAALFRAWEKLEL
jgi:hypothetical protein